MPVLTAGKPLTTTNPVLVVENKFPAGVVTFALAVVDQFGNVSAPAQLRVTIRPVPDPVPPPPPPVLHGPINPTPTPHPV
jgi:hypothetical protein